MKYLILFDIDGTILRLKKWKSREIFANLFLDFFNCNVPKDALPSFSGMTDLLILFEIAEKVGIEKSEILKNIDKIWDKIYNDFIPLSNKQNIILLTGIKEFIVKLNEIDNFQLGILTGNFKKNAYLKLKTHSLEHFFPDGAFGDDDPNRNNLPKIAYKRIINHCNCSDSEFKNIIIIGDSPRDIECAKLSGSISIAVATGDNTFEDLSRYNPDLIFQDFSDFDYSINKIIAFLSSFQSNHII